MKSLKVCIDFTSFFPKKNFFRRNILISRVFIFFLFFPNKAELAQIDETYQAKKKKFLESSEEFNKELKKHCVAAVDDAKYKEMVDEQLEKLKAEREERARAGAPTPPSPAPPTDPADTRHVLQPVDRGENPDSPDESGSQTSADGSKDGSNANKDEDGKGNEDGNNYNIKKFVYMF